MQRGDLEGGRRGERGSAYIRLHVTSIQNQECSTPSSAENLLLCQSGIGAAPIDKYPTAPGTASRYCTLFLGVVALVVACSPCSRSKSNLTPAAYHLTVQTVRMGYQVHVFSRLAAPRSPTRIGRHVQRGRSDRIQTFVRPAQTGYSRESPGARGQQMQRK